MKNRPLTSPRCDWKYVDSYGGHGSSDFNKYECKVCRKTVTMMTHDRDAPQWYDTPKGKEEACRMAECKHEPYATNRELADLAAKIRSGYKELDALKIKFKKLGGTQEELDESLS